MVKMLNIYCPGNYVIKSVFNNLKEKSRIFSKETTNNFKD